MRRKRLLAAGMAMVLMAGAVVGGEWAIDKLEVEAATQTVSDLDAFLTAFSLTDAQVDITLQSNIDFNTGVTEIVVPEGETGVTNQVTIDLNGYSLLNVPKRYFDVGAGGTLKFENNSAAAGSTIECKNLATAAAITVQGNGEVSFSEEVELKCSETESPGFLVSAENGGEIVFKDAVSGDSAFVSSTDEYITAVNKDVVWGKSVQNGKTNIELKYATIENEIPDTIVEQNTLCISQNFYSKYIMPWNPHYFEIAETVAKTGIKNVFIEEMFYSGEDGTNPCNLVEIHHNPVQKDKLTIYNGSDINVVKDDETIPDNLYVNWMVIDDYGMNYTYEDSVDKNFSEVYGEMKFVKAGSLINMVPDETTSVYAIVLGNYNGKELEMEDIQPLPNGSFNVYAPTFALNSIYGDSKDKMPASVDLDYTVSYLNLKDEMWTPNTICHNDYLVITPKEGYKIATPGAAQWTDSIIVSQEGVETSLSIEFAIGDLERDETAEIETYGLVMEGELNYQKMNCPPIIKGIENSSNQKPVKDPVVITVQAADTYSPVQLEYSFDGGQTWSTDRTNTYTESTVVPAGTILVRDGDADNYGVTVAYEEPLTVTIDSVSPVFNITGEYEEDANGQKTYDGIVEAGATDNLSENLSVKVYEGKIEDVTDLEPVKEGTKVSLYPKEENTVYTISTEDEAGNVTIQYIYMKAYAHELSAKALVEESYEYSSKWEIPVVLDNSGLGNVEIVSVDVSDTSFAVSGQAVGRLIEEATSSQAISLYKTEELVPGTYNLELQVTYKNADGIEKTLAETVTLTIVKAEGIGSLELENCYLGLDVEKAVKDAIVAENYSSENGVVYFKQDGEPDDSYTRNIPTKAGKYQVKVVVPGNECYEELTVIGELSIITREISSDMYVIEGTEGKNGWYTSEIQIKPGEGYSFYAVDETNAEESYSLKESGSVTFIIQLSDGSLTDSISLDFQIDTTAPVIGEAEGIKIGDSLWQTFLEVITFGLYESEYSEVTVKAHDTESDVVISYYVSDKALTMEEASVCAYTTGDTFSIDKEGKHVVYAKVENAAGLITYISSDGMIYDVQGPVIAGVTEGGSYKEAVTVTVTDDNLSEVTLNGEKQTIANNSCTIEVLPTKEAVTCIVKASDKGNIETSCEFTMEAVEEESKEPEESTEPEESAEPEESIEPEESAGTEATAKPKESAEPEEVVKPEGSTGTEVTAKPKESVEPEEVVKPEGSTGTEATAKPKESVEPEEVVKPEGSTGTEATAKPKESVEPEEIAESEESQEPEKIIIRSGEKMTLKAGVSYWLDSGTWRVDGDATIYNGGISIRVAKSGEYRFIRE